MSNKKIIIKPKLELQNAQQKIDKWINNNPSNELDKNEKNLFEDYRFTVVIPANLHRRIKKHCVIHDVTMKDKLIEIFEKEFPET